MGVESRGTIAEAEFLGEIIDPEKLASKEKKLKERLGWLTQDQLMDNVKEFQPGNPSDPEKQFPGDIFALIAEKITPDDYDRLRYYTAVTRKEDIVLKSRLDYCEGVDFFFEFDSEEGVVKVTCDFALFEKSETDFKADVLAVIPDEDMNPKDDPKLWESTTKKIAEDIIWNIKERIKEIKKKKEERP
ncbi:MAG: hypothetical protein US74_C0015G0028 [Parcubacteria group bacterium GW2011_GWA2_38_13]|nr:MAG: hypothetical protein US74_C0015G0028 [Parcubacteria group bacterium GW2011_GWA2_38_13]